MITSDDIARLGDIPPAEDLDMVFATGDDDSDSLWKNFINTRLRVDGDNVFLKVRGGSNSIETFSAQILTIYSFAATINAVQKDYLAIHCADGSAYVYDIALDSQTQLFAGIFSTTNQVRFVHNGIFLYIFDTDLEVFKYYNLETGTGYDWMASISGAITDVSWITGTWIDDNFWDLHEGSNLLILHNYLEGKYVDPDTNQDTHRAFTTKIDSVFANYFNYETPDGSELKSNANTPLFGFAPGTPDVLEDFDRYASLYRISEDGSSVDNDEYQDPVIYKGYMVVDLLDDGNYLTPGRPITISSSLMEINTNYRIGAELTVAAPAPGVVKRYLFATRWQTSPDNAFDPSRPKYPNSAFFLVKPIGITQTTVRDYTPDSKLLTELASFIPLTAGILQMFSAGEIVPNTVSTARSTLLIGGYKVSRPTPQPYTDAANSAGKNIYFDQVAGGTNLTGSPELCYQFEYTDGKKSAIVNSAQILTDAEEDEIVTPGEAGEEATTELWTPQYPPGGVSNVTIQYPYGEVDEVTVTVPYSDTDTIQDVVSAVNNAINADGTIQMTSDIYNAATQLRFTEKRTGSTYNGNLVRIAYPPDPSIAFLTMTGGQATIVEKKLSGQRLQIHGLNALVAKIFVLATDTVDATVDYRLLREVEVTDAGFTGKVLYLLNSDVEFNALSEYVAPPATDQRESIDLPGWMVPAVPFQQPRINEQKELEGSVRIGRIIPWRFASDQSQLRFQVVIFTETNIQLGYLSFNTGGSFSLDASFEIILEGLRAGSFDAIENINGDVYFPGDRYMYRWNGQQPQIIFDVNRYSVSKNNDPIDVIFNQDNYEVWFIYPDQDVIVLNIFDMSTRRMNFNHLGTIRSAGFYGGSVYLGAGTSLVETDLPGQDYDLSAANVVEGVAQSKPLTPQRYKSKILEAIVGGQGGTVELDIDLQPERLEGDTSVWAEDFTSAQNYPAKTLYIHGASFNIRRRAVRPRLQITLKSGFIEYVTLRHVVTENKGIARKS